MQVQAKIRIVALAMLTAVPGSARAGDPVVTFGDSLTFAYESEFGFKIDVFGSSIGDGFGPEVRNWIEILNDSAYRQDSFDLGARDSIVLNFPFSASHELFFRHERNWSIPGARVADLRAFIEDRAGLLEILGKIDEFAAIGSALAYSDFNEETDFSLADFESQISSKTKRFVLFVGGNDARGAYGEIYEGGDAGAFCDAFLADLEAIIDRVQELNPALPIVVVSVPHVGITPDVKASYPPDPIKTARVSAALAALNQRIAALAGERKLAYADVFTATLPLLEERPFVISGIPYQNSGSASGALDFIWLNGPISSNFHPNTNAQSFIANAIIDALNANYGSAIRPLGGQEILGGLLGETSARIDMSFPDYLAAHGLPPGTPAEDDSDGDGIDAAVEFALGLDLRRADAIAIHHEIESGEEGAALVLRYRPRLSAAETTKFSLVPMGGSELGALAPLIPVQVLDDDGFVRSRLPVSSGANGFIRLGATLAP